MTSEIEETATTTRESSWCAKIFEYVKNRNRISPGKIELADCDFFIVGPRRTLRVLLPVPRGNVYYETTINERPETIDENFVSRWATRPHSSGNCRCSFGQTKNRLCSNDEIVINREIDRVRRSVREAEKTGEDIEKLEKTISLNFEDLVTNDLESISMRRETIDDMIDTTEVSSSRCNDDDDRAKKNKIVKELEDYIERLLHEVLTDTMKFFNDAGHTLRKSHEILKKVENRSSKSLIKDSRGDETSCVINEKTKKSRISIDNEARKLANSRNSFDINFAFHDNNTIVTLNDQTTNINDRGYVNRGFTGATNDPDSLDFHLQKNLSSGDNDNLDCTDSGINSVETIEFQMSQEPSLEQSLMEIMDAKFGRGSSKRCWKNIVRQDHEESDDRTIVDLSKNSDKCKISGSNNLEDFSIAADAVDEEKTKFTIQHNEESRKDIASSKETFDENSETRSKSESSMELEETTQQSNFDKLRLELLETENSGKGMNAIEALREKFRWKFAAGCKNNRDEKSENLEKMKNEETAKRIRETTSSPRVELRIKNETNDNTDNVEFRRFRKPIVVFLHGFGSSAEIFENQLVYFSNLGYTCVAPELLGHGMSSAPDCSRDYHFDKLLKDLELILQHYAFGKGRKCVLVAHNYGCSFATALACKYESNIHQLVLISGGGPTPLAPPSVEGTAHCCLRAMLTPLLMCGIGRDMIYSARGRQHPYCGSEPIDRWPSHMRYVLDGMIWPEGDYVFHRRIISPVLLIHGLRDDKVSLVQECQMERTIVKGFLDAIPMAGHTPMIDCPEQVNHMIHCFIDLWKRKKR